MLGERLLGVLDLGDDADAALVVELAFGREAELAGGAVDEAHAELLLDARHQLADRRGAELHGTRRGREAARVDHLHEGFDAACPIHCVLR